MHGPCFFPGIGKSSDEMRVEILREKKSHSDVPIRGRHGICAVLRLKFRLILGTCIALIGNEKYIST